MSTTKTAKKWPPETGFGLRPASTNFRVYKGSSRNRGPFLFLEPPQQATRGGQHLKPLVSQSNGKTDPLRESGALAYQRLFYFRAQWATPMSLGAALYGGGGVEQAQHAHKFRRTT